MDFDTLVDEALTSPFTGWDFGAFHGRFVTGSTPWSYEDFVRERIRRMTSLLDIGTGGGELLASLAPLPIRTAATEGHPPNIPIARERLTPLGVEVAGVTDDMLPFPDASFELVVNRHHSYDAAEVRRVLTRDGTFFTQQVSGRDLAGLNAALAAPRHRNHDWDLQQAIIDLTGAGFAVTWRAESAGWAEFCDVGAIVMYLRVVSWQVPDFDVEKYRPRLRALHEQAQAGRPLRFRYHRFALIAKPV